MKILMINKFYYFRGGSEHYVFELSKLLESYGHQVVFFSMQDERNIKSKFSEYFIKKVDLQKFNLINIIKFFYNYESVKKLKKIIKYEKPEVAHLHNIAHQISPAIIKVLRKNNIPIVQTLHDYKIICPNYRLYSRRQICQLCRGGKYYNCFFRKCLHNSWLKSFLGMLEAYLNNKIFKYYDLVDLFIAPSQFMKDVCIRFGIAENKIKVIYNFIDVTALTNDNLANKKEEPEYILYFGRLSQEKGIGILLDALAKVNGVINLKIVGAGLERKNLELRIKNLELSDRVEIVGPKYGDELKQIIIRAKAVIMPSLWPENMPYSILEALALGKIVIASRTGGLPEIIQDGCNGLLFNSGDSIDLAKKIDLVLANNQLAKNIENNAKLSLNKFNSQAHYWKISEIYQDLI